MIFSYFHLIIYINKFLIYSCTISFQKNNNNNFQFKNILIKPRRLSNYICNIKNCLACDNRNECINCKEGYQLDNKRCYSKNCEIYGFCKFCDEYDCLKCLKGYKLNYGICDRRETSKKKLFMIIAVPMILLALIIYLCIRYKKLARIKISTGQVIKFIHPRAGFYQLNYENKNEIVDMSRNKIFSSSNETGSEKEPPVVKCCVVCGNKNTYSIADCGCSLCQEHDKIIKIEKNINCRVHNVILTSTISFKMAVKSDIKGNALEKLGLPKCPICKINDGTQSFNCGCPMRLCEKCFNDNVYVLKYNQCPGCGKPYIPIKNLKKRNKSSEETIKK